MTIASPPSLDHVGYVGRSLEALRAGMERLGFATTEPRDLMGVDDATGRAMPLRQRSCHAVFERGYVELSAVETDDPRHHLAVYRQRGDGLHILALGSAAIAAEHARCVAAGIGATALAQAARRIEYGERHGEARFEWFMFKPDESPDGLVCYAANLTPELVYQRSVMAHPNGACGLAEVCLLTDEVSAGAARYARLLGFAGREHAGQHEFALDGGRLSILDARGFESRFGVSPSGAPGRFAATVVSVRDAAACERLLRERGVIAWRSGMLLVTRFAAGGNTLLAFCA
jgi:hypothetical protein